MKVKKILGIALNVLLYALLAACLFLLFVSVSSKKDSDGAATVLGKQFRLIRSDSMAESEFTDVSGYDIGSLPIKTLIVVDTVPTDEAEAEEWYASLEVGDVLTFRYVYTAQETITHRITSIEKKETGGYIIELKGDNATSETAAGTQTIDTSVAESPNYVIGKVTGKSYVIGLLIYALKTPVGIVCIVILPCAIIIGLEIVRIVSVITEEKRKKAQEQSEKQESEIEKLKRELAALQNAVSGNQVCDERQNEAQNGASETAEETAMESTEEKIN